VPLISLVTIYVTLALSLVEVFVSVALGVINRNRYMTNNPSSREDFGNNGSNRLSWKYQV
jgi:hypothetical protein